MVSTHHDGTVQVWDLELLTERSPGFFTLEDLHASALAFARRCSDRGESVPALRACEEALRHGTRALALAPEDRRTRGSVADVHGLLAEMLTLEGKQEEAQKHLTRVVEMREALAREYPRSLAVQSALAEAHALAGALAYEEKRFGDAVKHYDTALGVYGRVAGLPQADGRHELRETVQRLERVREVCRLAVRAVDDLPFALAQDVERIPELLLLRIQHLAAKGKHAELADTAQRLAERYPEDIDAVYNAACVHALAARALEAGRPPERLSPEEGKKREQYLDRTFALLRSAIRLGMDDLAFLRQDPDLEKIRSDPRFAGLAGEVGKPPVSVGDQDPRALRYRYQAGEKLSHVAEMKMSAEGSSGERTATSEVEMLVETTTAVDRVDPDGVAHLKSKVDRLRMTISAPGGRQLTFDSDTKEPASEAALPLLFLRALVGMEMEASIDARGRLRSFKVPDSIQAVAARAPSWMASQMQDMLSEAKLKKLVGLDSLPLPAAPPVPGTTWRGRPEVQKLPIGTMSSETRYTFLGPQMHAGKMLHRIALRKTLRFEPDAKLPAQMLLAPGRHIEGNVYFDPEKCRVVELSIQGDIGFEIRSGGTTTRQRMRSTGTLRLREDMGP